MNRTAADKWFRVEVTDHAGQVVAIESEMLAGRDIGGAEQETINRAIDHLCGFIGRDLAALSREQMDKELEWILGRPNFACSGIFQTLRKGGHEIAKHAEEEQAASIYWMLGHYFKHGPDKWRDEAEKELKAIHQKSLAALPSRGGEGK